MVTETQTLFVLRSEGRTREACFTVPAREWLRQGQEAAPTVLADSPDAAAEGCDHE